MSFISKTVKIGLTLYALKQLTKPWNKTKWFKLGIIDASGERIVDPSDMTPEQKRGFGMFDKLLYILRKSYKKIPFFGNSPLASYATALLILKEDYSIDVDSSIRPILESTDDPIHIFLEEQQQNKNSIIIENGDYITLKDSVIYEEENGNKIRIVDSSQKIQNICGSNLSITIFEGISFDTGKTVFFTEENVSSPTNSSGSIGGSTTAQDDPESIFYPTKNTKKVKKDKEEEEESKLTIDEVLSSSDPIEKWISDFVNSDNPRFKGKSKEKRKEMAIAAFYNAKEEK